MHVFKRKYFFFAFLFFYLKELWKGPKIFIFRRNNEELAKDGFFFKNKDSCHFSLAVGLFRSFWDKKTQQQEDAK